jgi:hypothetical protein
MRFEQGDKVVYYEGDKEIKGTVKSAPPDGVWVEWETDFHWAHKHLFISHNSSMLKNIKLADKKKNG